MKIAVLASLLRAVSNESSGGTEAFTSILAEGLVEREHDVTLFATSDSKTRSKLVSICSSNQTTGVFEGPVAGNIPYELIQARNVVKQANEFDIIHNNYWFYYSLTSFSTFCERPIITTIHNNFWHYPNLKEALIQTHRKNRDVVVFLSESAKKLAGDLVDSTVINNGIYTSDFPFSPNSQEYILWFSRLDPKKGIKPAIDAAQKGSFPLTIAGAPPIKPKNKAYIEKKIFPFFSDTITYVGEPNKEQKVSLYQNAKALLFPTLMEEQFPLVVLEAMSCGTPVIAFNRGALSEEIKDGVTGFIVDPDDESRPNKGTWVIKKQGVEGLIEAVNRIGEINRFDCRSHIEKYFTKDRMIAQYIELYKRVSNY